jgi:hypothetical protein
MEKFAAMIVTDLLTGKLTGKTCEPGGYLANGTNFAPRAKRF